MNCITLVGRAGRDPEVRNFDNGKCKAAVTMAVSRPKKDAPADWFRIEAWDKQGQILAAYVKKGDMFGVIGAININQYEKDGQKLSSTVVIAHQIRLLTGKDSSTESQERQSGQSNQSSTDPFAGLENNCPF